MSTAPPTIEPQRSAKPQGEEKSARPPAPGAGEGTHAAPLPRLPIRVWSLTAIISATFTLIVAVTMLVTYQRSIAEDPLNVTKLQTLREQLHAKPDDEGLKKQIRLADLAERQRYFTRVERNKAGGWLLLVGGAVFVLSVTQFLVRRRTMPVPQRLVPWADFEQDAARSRLAIGGTAGVVLAAIAVIALTQRPASVTPSTKTTAVKASAAPTAEWLRNNSPRFRGADGAGVSAFTNIPLMWNLGTRENIAWSSRVPLSGYNSPVVVGDRVFLTGAEKTVRELFCFDAKSGALRWRLPAKLVSDDAVDKMELSSLTGAAVATMAADAQRVYAIFGTGELIAADHSGQLMWSKNFGKPENPYGVATSLVMWRDKLLVQLDQGAPEAGKSRLYAFDGATGIIVWETRRTLPSSWATPIVINAAAEQVVCIGEPWLISYDAVDGKERWRFGGLGGDLAPSPVFAGGLLFVISSSQELFAIKPGGQGDVTKTHLAWKVDQNIPDIVSPVSDGELLFLMETYGTLVCLEAKTGKKLWEHAYDTEFNASLSIVGDRVLAISTEGEAITVRAGREFQELSRSKLGEQVKASPAFVDGRMFIRGATNLFCIASVKGGGQ